MRTWIKNINIPAISTSSVSADTYFDSRLPAACYKIFSRMIIKDCETKSNQSYCACSGSTCPWYLAYPYPPIHILPFLSARDLTYLVLNAQCSAPSCPIFLVWLIPPVLTGQRGPKETEYVNLVTRIPESKELKAESGKRYIHRVVPERLCKWGQPLLL